MRSFEASISFAQTQRHEGRRPCRTMPAPAKNSRNVGVGNLPYRTLARSFILFLVLPNSDLRRTAPCSLLAGLRVLDLSTIVAGPAASMILADLGADVIKVERPGTGEDARAMGPHRGAFGAYFAALNRGKRSIAIDLRKPAGREAVLR